MKIGFWISLILTLIISVNGVKAQLANSYPGDVGIEKDAAVLYVEKFDDGITKILSRYSDKKNAAGMLTDTDVPPGSPGPNSLKMTSIQGANDGGHLYRRFNPGFDSIVYIRYYVKYPSESKGYFHHESVWFGGYNPATDWPSPKAGTCGLGDKRLSISFEPVWQNTNPPGMDTYIYWGDMKAGASLCYGNAMISQGAEDYNKPIVPGSYPVVTFDQWMCVEIMIKLNHPVTAYNGEMAVWINGVMAGHWGPGFPNGHWYKDKWYKNPSDQPFEGFRWRTDARLNINWLWIEFYHDNPNAPSSNIKFDHLVMATKYIGPLVAATGTGSIPSVTPAFRIYPSPFSDRTFIRYSLTSKTNVSLNITNSAGIKVAGMADTELAAGDYQYIFEAENLPSGMYFCTIKRDDFAETHKILLSGNK